MARFSRGCPHAEAVRAVREGDWFAEELYARFHVTGTAGTWGGACPLTPGRKAAA
jgi:spheroidene monooxygenase